MLDEAAQQGGGVGGALVGDGGYQGPMDCRQSAAEEGGKAASPRPFAVKMRSVVQDAGQDDPGDKAPGGGFVEGNLLVKAPAI